MQQQLDKEEQGFTSEPPIVEIEPIRTAITKYYTPKIYTHPLKLLLPHQLVLKKEYINQQLQNQRRDDFEMENPCNIVYNCHNKARMFSLKNLAFDSNFQSGNLEYVVQRGPCQYWLYIRPDLNTKSHFQWFYFTIKNKKAQRCTFVIKNFVKPNLYYLNGLKPFYRSKNKCMNHYQQISSEVSYLANQTQQNSTTFYQLQFQFQFDKKNDEIQFCSQPPYTYTHLNHMLKRTNHPKIQIGKTMLGHSIYALVINESVQTKAVVVAFARQHPGQSVGSWMIEGFITKISCLPNQITWIIVPMVNIDGVIVGNNRTGILGTDFNRNWYLQESRKSLNPEIASIMRYIKSKNNKYKKKTKLFLDFHGHSSQANVFTYGPPHPRQSKDYYLSKLFPYLLNKKNADFNFNQCSFQIDQSKRNCARAVFLNKLGFPFSYTIQSSFGIYQNKQINEVDVMKIGQDIGETVIQFLKLLTNNDKNNVKQQNNIAQLINIMQKDILQLQNYAADNSGSEDEDQNDPIRIKFVKRIQEMFVKSTQTHYQRKAEHRSTKKSINLSTRTLEYMGTQNSAKRQSQRRQKTEPKSDKIKINMLRLKTQYQGGDSYEGMNISSKNIILPKINQSFKIPSGLKQKNYIDKLNFDIMTLTEIKQKLFSMKKSKLGRRFLILQ